MHLYLSAHPSVFSHIVIFFVTSTFLLCNSSIKYLLCAAVGSAPRSRGNLYQHATCLSYRNYYKPVCSPLQRRGGDEEGRGGKVCGTAGVRRRAASHDRLSKPAAEVIGKKRNHPLIRMEGGKTRSVVQGTGEASDD